MCMPYFALPQVDSPVNHPTFNVRRCFHACAVQRCAHDTLSLLQSLLQPEWSARLRMKLRRFLRATLPYVTTRWLPCVAAIA